MGKYPLAMPMFAKISDSTSVSTQLQWMVKRVMYPLWHIIVESG